MLVALDAKGDVWSMTDGDPYRVGLQAISITAGRSFVIAQGSNQGEVWGWGDNEFNQILSGENKTIKMP